MSNANSPGTTPGEYTRGTGFTFPNQPTIAQNTAESSNSSTVTAGASVAVAFPANPTQGQLFYNRTTSLAYVWTGAAWGPVGGSSSSLTVPVAINQGGTGTASPSGVIAGSGITVTGAFPAQTVALTSPFPSLPLSIANGGTGTSSPTGVSAGTGITVTGSFPAQTVALTTPVAIASGGTGSATKNFVDLTNPQTVAGAKTFTGILSITPGTPPQTALLIQNNGTTGRTSFGVDGTANIAGILGTLLVLGNAGVANLVTVDTSGNVGVGSQLRAATNVHAGAGTAAPSSSINTTDLSSSAGPGLGAVSFGSGPNGTRGHFDFGASTAGHFSCGNGTAYVPIDASAFNVSSAAKFKRDIQTLTYDALALVRGVKMVSYHYRSDADDVPLRPGPIADTLPAVLGGPKGETFNLGAGLALLWAASQQILERLEAVEHRLGTAQ